MGLNFRYHEFFGQELVDIQATIELRAILKLVREMVSTCGQMHYRDKYSNNNSIIWTAWLSGWTFVYELSGCGFESCYS